MKEHDHSEHDDSCPICWRTYWEAWREYRAEDEAVDREDENGYPIDMEGW